MEPISLHPADHEKLVHSARLGDRAAFIALAGAHQRTVYRVAFAVLRDREPARRVAIDTLLRAWRSIRRMPETLAFGVWLTRSAHHLALVQQRRVSETGRPATAFKGAPPPGAHPAAFERCEAAFAALTPEHQHALALRLVASVGYTDLAKVLDIPVAVAVARVSGARSSMISRLGGPELLE